MPIPEENRLRFYIYVIESPSAVDLYHRRSEGEIIRQAAALNGIQCSVVTAINSISFEAAFKIGLAESMQSFPGLIPMLHISAHGDKNGIQLSSGEILTWTQLRTFLAPVNNALNNNLLVSLSCCEGYAGIQMAMHLEDEELPFFAIVANGEKPLWSDTAVAYSTFYHLVAKGEYLIDAVNAMRVASGNDKFWIQTGHESRQVYIDHINGLSAINVQQELEDNAAAEDSGHLEQLRKLSNVADSP